MAFKRVWLTYNKTVVFPWGLNKDSFSYNFSYGEKFRLEQISFKHVNVFAKKVYVLVYLQAVSARISCTFQLSLLGLLKHIDLCSQALSIYEGLDLTKAFITMFIKYLAYSTVSFSFSFIIRGSMVQDRM